MERGAILTVSGGSIAAGVLVDLLRAARRSFPALSATAARCSQAAPGACLRSPAAPLSLASTANIPSPTAGAGSVALLGSYMASLFTSVEGAVATTTTDTAQSQAVLADPHTG